MYVCICIYICIRYISSVLQSKKCEGENLANEEQNNSVNEVNKMAAGLEEGVKGGTAPGIVYISKVPPFMKPGKVKCHMEQFGEVGRVFLQPEGTIYSGLDSTFQSSPAITKVVLARSLYKSKHEGITL